MTKYIDVRVLELAGLDGKLNGDEHHSSQQQEKGGSNG